MRGAHVWFIGRALVSSGQIFLNGIWGNFAGAGSIANIFASGGSWYLNGAGDTRTTGRCAGLGTGNSFSGEYTWSAAQNLPTNMGSTSGRVCFLVRVSGSFASAADWVRIYASGGSWFLFGGSQKGDGGAQARCVSVSTFSGEHSWNSTQGYDTHMGASSGQVCGLTYMAGQFTSQADGIQIYSSSGSWYLGGAATVSPVYARARCF